LKIVFRRLWLLTQPSIYPWPNEAWRTAALFAQSQASRIRSKAGVESGPNHVLVLKQGPRESRCLVSLRSAGPPCRFWMPDFSTRKRNRHGGRRSAKKAGAYAPSLRGPDRHQAIPLAHISGLVILSGANRIAAGAIGRLNLMEAFRGDSVAIDA